MRHLKTTIHPDIDTLEHKSIFQRKATRAIVLKDGFVLVLYTKRYDDYSLPGGGLDEGEEHIDGMTRELLEETGAKHVRDVKEFGVYEEYRPWYKDDFDVQHMISYCYTCSVDQELGETKLESYESNNGMSAMWMKLDEVIAHNEKTIQESPKKGMSIERETFLMKLIKEEFF